MFGSGGLSVRLKSFEKILTWLVFLVEPTEVGETIQGIQIASVRDTYINCNNFAAIGLF